MKVIIVAAGIGASLGELTKDIPKPLVDVNGKSILQRQIEIYRKFGVDEIFIVTGYKTKKIKHLMRFYPKLGYNTQIIDCYIATDLVKASEPKLEDGELLSVKKVNGINF